MTRQETRQKIKQITNKIIKEYKPEKIILFGSFAVGKSHKDSDVDLFIIKKSRKPKVERLAKVEKILSKRTLPVDILVYTPKEVEERLSLRDFFIEDIIKKGKLLYDSK